MKPRRTECCRAGAAPWQHYSCFSFSSLTAPPPRLCSNPRSAGYGKTACIVYGKPFIHPNDNEPLSVLHDFTMRHWRAFEKTEFLCSTWNQFSGQHNVWPFFCELNPVAGLGRKYFALGTKDSAAAAAPRFLQPSSDHVVSTSEISTWKAFHCLTRQQAVDSEAESRSKDTVWQRSKRRYSMYSHLFILPILRDFHLTEVGSGHF